MTGRPAAQGFPRGATALLKGFADGSLSPEAVGEALLDEAEAANQRYHHIVSIPRGEALAASRESAARWREGRPRRLEGLPFALKGMIPTDSPVVARLEAQGAYLQCVVVPSGYGTPLRYAPGSAPRNPVDAARMPGGSSTGSGIALAAGHVPLAVGSDAAGSIRIPSACCEVWGLKPSRGLLPAAGGMGLSHSLGEAGPMARSGADLELLQAAMSGEPAADAIVAPRLAAVLTDGLDAVAGAAFSRALEAVAATGATIAGADLRLVAESRAAGWTVLCYEAALAMAPHLDAIRAAPTSFLKYADRGAGISRTDYEAALATGRAFADAVDAVLGDADALITPCAPFALPRADDPDLGAKTPLMGEMFLPFSLSGHPAVVVPLRVDGAVVPVQLVGRTGGDAALVALARGIAASS